MAVNRTSTSLVRFLGVELSAESINSKLSSVFRGSTGQERTVSPSARLFTDGQVAASININEFHTAIAALESRGVDKKVARGMAVVFVDVSERAGYSVARLISALDSNTISLVETRVYQYINQLRDPITQLGRSPKTTYKNSLLSRQLALNETGTAEVSYLTYQDDEAILLENDEILLLEGSDDLPE